MVCWPRLLDNLWYEEMVGGGRISQMGGILAWHPAAPGSILGIFKNFSLDVAEIYRRHDLEQWTEALSCQSSPSTAGKWQASTKKYEEIKRVVIWLVCKSMRIDRTILSYF